MMAIPFQLRRIWHFFRALTGDDAYERYRRHAAVCHPDQPLMDPKAFYLERQRRKWSGVSRCC